MNLHRDIQIFSWILFLQMYMPTEYCLRIKYWLQDKLLPLDEFYHVMFIYLDLRICMPIDYKWKKKQSKRNMKSIIQNSLFKQLQCV